MEEIRVPRTTEELRKALQEKAREIEAYLHDLTPDELFAPQGSYWSPAEHLRHLVKSVRPLARALRMPKVLLLLRFGPSLRGTRSFEAVRDRYLEELAAGGTAGPFAPSSRKEASSPEEWRQEIFGYWRQVSQDLSEAMAGWGETALDRLRLPHPLLGKLTVREMLAWTLYHNHHHLQRVKQRRPGSGRPDVPSPS